MHTPPQDLVSEHRQIISGVKWLAVSQTIQLITQFLGVIILARLLQPSDFGLLAMAMIVTGFVSLFSDLGTVAGIIQRPDPSIRLINSLFWLNTIIGAAIFVLVAALAPLIALAFDEHRVQYVLWALMLIFPLTCLGSVQRALLEKASHFSPVAIIEATSAVIGLAGAVCAARSGWGVFSLVLQPLLSTFVTTSSLWLVSPWRPALYWDAAEIRSMMKFGGNLVGSNIFSYFSRNADNLMIGYFIGPLGLGIYSMAYRIMLFPLTSISVVISRALFPSFSRSQSNPQQMGAMFIQLAQAIVFITAPMMVGIFVLRDTFVKLTLGPQWAEVSKLLFWLAPVGLLQSVVTCVGIIFIATGHTDIKFKWELAAGSVIVLAIAVGIPWGIEGVAIAYSLIAVLEVVPLFIIAFRLIGLKLNVLVRAVSLPVLLSVLMGLVLYCAKVYLPLNSGNSGVNFVLLIILGAVTYALLSIVFQRKLAMSIWNSLTMRTASPSTSPPF